MNTVLSKSLFLVAVGTSVVGFGCPTDAHASTVANDVIYSSMAANPFNTGHGWTIAGSSTSSTYNGYASAFTPSSDATANQLEVSVGISSGTYQVQVGLYSDPTNLPGSLISGLYTVNIPAYASSPEFVYLTTPVALTGGTQYFVGVLPGASDTNGNWNQNPGVAAYTGYTGDGSTWYDSGYGNTAYSGEFAVLGTVTPEPASLALLTLGGLALLVMPKRKQPAQQPEVGEWSR